MKTQSTFFLSLMGLFLCSNAALSSDYIRPIQDKSSRSAQPGQSVKPDYSVPQQEKNSIIIEDHIIIKLAPESGYILPINNRYILPISKK